MQLDTRIAQTIDGFGPSPRPSTEQAVHRNLVMLVQSPIHPFRDGALNADGASGNRSPQMAFLALMQMQVAHVFMRRQKRFLEFVSG
jgi:hypothetical protein